jgi:hypothetical protein
MTITQVTVSAHEKRNHPYEYGHRDSGIELTATMVGTNFVPAEIETLQNYARMYVDKELDAWIQKIEKERQLDGIRMDLSNMVYTLENTSHPLSTAKRILTSIKRLPLEEQDGWRKKVKFALKTNKTNREYDKKGELPF